MNKLLTLTLLLATGLYAHGQQFLQLDRPTWPFISFSENGVGAARIQGSGGLFAVTSYNGGTNYFTVNSASGAVGIGTSTPGNTLDVAGAASYGAGQIIRNTTATGYSTLRLYNDLNQNVRALEIDYGGSQYASSLVNGGPTGESASITTTSSTPLVFGTGNTARMTIASSGYVGIGTPSPLSVLQVNSSIERQTFRIYKNGNTNNYLNIWQGTGGAALDPIGTGLLYLGYDQPTNVIMGRTGSGQNMGNVGIGTASPDQKLTVNGTIHASEVQIDLNVPAPDYVFEKEYKLPKLEEVKRYVDANKHLPEVPSAKEMEKNGIQVGEMNMILLKKVEELTLYLIEESKNKQEMRLQMEKQQNKIDEQGKQIEELMKRN